MKNYQLPITNPLSRESVWITEHHFAGFGLIGVPSVYAAGIARRGIAQRTRRFRICYAVVRITSFGPGVE